MLDREKIHLYFSLLFILWCASHLFACQKEGTVFKKSHQYDVEDVPFSFFWTMVMFLTAFNVAATLLNCADFYLVGASGMIMLCFAKLVVGTAMLLGFLSKGYVFYRSSYILFSFPFVLFGIQSSLYCYQQKLGQNPTKFQLICLKFCCKDYKTIVRLFHLTCLTCMFVFCVSAVQFISTDPPHFLYGSLFYLFGVILLPTIAIFSPFSVKMNYIGTMMYWVVIGGLSTVICIFGISRFSPESEWPAIPSRVAFALIGILNAFIGITAAYSLLSDVETCRNPTSCCCKCS